MENYAAADSAEQASLKRTLHTHIHTTQNGIEEQWINRK